MNFRIGFVLSYVLAAASCSSSVNPPSSTTSTLNRDGSTGTGSSSHSSSSTNTGTSSSDAAVADSSACGPDVNYAHDPNNCGRCGNVCATTTPFCCGGECIRDCAEGLSLCCDTNPPGVCIDMQTNPFHCGACGHACGVGEECVGGACASPDGGS